MGNLEFPIKFKYLRIEVGLTAIQREGEVALPGYVVKDGEDIVIASGTSLASIFEYALQLDMSYELMHQFIFRGNLERMNHLEGVDCDDTGPVGLIQPTATNQAPSGGFKH